MRESELLAHIHARSAALAALFPHVLVGPGDDCAVLAAPAGSSILAKVDQVIEGRHFVAPAGRATSLDLVARKAIARSVSDIAAMGGSLTPWGAALATAALPHAFPQHDADQLFDRMKHWAEHWRCPLVGGDIASFAEGPGAGPLTLTVTVLGLAHPIRGPVLRSTARPGDDVYVTGALGGSLASGRHLTFEPRLAEAAALCEALGPALHSMMDISDGLGRDAARIAAASGVVIDLDSASLPLHPGRDWVGAVNDGEDYELLFTVAPGTALSSPLPATATPVTRIGAVRAARTPDESGRCLMRTADSRVIDVSETGWDHT